MQFLILMIPELFRQQPEQGHIIPPKKTKFPTKQGKTVVSSVSNF